MLATRGDELTARKCACCAMSGLGLMAYPLPTLQTSPLSPSPYAPIGTETPQALTTSPTTSLSPPESEPIPVKKPFDWGKVTGLFSTYSSVDTAKRDAEHAEREADRRVQIARTAKQAADAKARAAAEAQGILPPKQGMGTGTKIAIGAGVAVAAVVAVKAFS